MPAFVRTRSEPSRGVDVGPTATASRGSTRQSSRGAPRDRSKSTAEEPSGQGGYFNRDAAQSIGRRSTLYNRTELEESLLRDVDAEDASGEGDPNAGSVRRAILARGASPRRPPVRASQPSSGGAASPSRQDETTRELDFRVVREGSTAGKAFAVVTRRQQQKKDEQKDAMRRASTAFLGKVAGGLAPGPQRSLPRDPEAAAAMKKVQHRTRIVNARLKAERDAKARPASTVNLPPAAQELLMREYQQMHDLQRIERADKLAASLERVTGSPSRRDACESPRHALERERRAVDAFLAEQLASVHREARTASRVVEERLFATLGCQRDGSPDRLVPFQSPTSGADDLAVDLFREAVDAAKVSRTDGSDSRLTSTGANVADSLKHARSVAQLPRLTTPASRVSGASTSRPSTQQRKYDERTALTSRNGRRLPASRVVSMDSQRDVQSQPQGVVSPVALPGVDAAPTDLSSQEAATASVEPTPQLVHQSDDDEAGDTLASPSSRNASRAAGGVRFRLSSARAKSPGSRAPGVQAPFTPATNYPQPPPSRGAAPSARPTTRTATRTGSKAESAAENLATRLESRRPELEKQPIAARDLAAEFARWAPTAIRESAGFSSLGRWAAMAYDEARQAAERAATAQARERGCIADELEAILDEKRREREEAEEAEAKRLERRRSAHESGRLSSSAVEDDGLSDDDSDDLDRFPTAAVRSGPNRHMLNTTLMIIDHAMGTNPAYRDLWPALRDELHAAIFVDYERRVTKPVPLSVDEAAEIVDATDSAASIDRAYWDPTGEYGGPLLASTGTTASPIAVSDDNACAPTKAEVLEQIHHGRAAFEEYRLLRSEHKRVTGVMAAQSKAADRLAMITQMAFNRSTRRAIISSFNAWRDLTRRSKLYRFAVERMTTHKRAQLTTAEVFGAWRAAVLTAKWRRCEKKYEDQRLRYVTAAKDHAETVATMNARYDTDVKALEFELFQEGESRKNMLQVHQLEQEEWARELHSRDEEVTTLKRVVRQWQRAAQLSNPVDDPSPPPSFLLNDVAPLKQLEDTLMAFFVNSSQMGDNGMLGGGSLITPAALGGATLNVSAAAAAFSGPSGLGASTSSFHRAASFASSVGSAVSAAPSEVAGRIVDGALLDYIAGGWTESIPPVPSMKPDPVTAFTETVAQARRELETFLCTWVNYEIRHVKLPPGAMSAGTAGNGPMQITNASGDLRDGVVYLALCRALTPKEHQRRGDLDVFLTLSSLMAVQTAHGLVPPLLLHCPFHREFFTPEAFRPANGLPHGPTAVGHHPSAGLWILASLFVAKSLKTATSSKYGIHESLAPQVRFSPAIVGMPRPPAGILVGGGPDNVAAQLASGNAGGDSAATAGTLLPGTGQRNMSRAPKRHESMAASRASKSAAASRRDTRLTVRSLSELGASAFRGSRRSRPGSAASSASGGSTSSFESEYDEDDEWLAQEDDDNFRIAVPEALRRLGPSQLISHWIKLREHGQKWNGLARVVTALVTRFRILDVSAADAKAQRKGRKSRAQGMGASQLS